MIDQNRPWLQRWTRPDGAWHGDEITSIDATLPITALACEIPLRELYIAVKFPPDPIAVL